jgi:hypothetical protein
MYEPMANEHGYASTFRTVQNLPWAGTHHREGSPAKRGLCTVAGVEVPHRATRSLLLRDSWGDSWWASCEEHVPPAA